MIRTLLRYFASTNSEQIIQKLSDSYVMRRAAQMVVSIFFRSKAIAQEQKLDKTLSPERIKSLIDKFKSNIKEEVENVKRDLESKTKR